MLSAFKRFYKLMNVIYFSTFYSNIIFKEMYNKNYYC